MTPTPTPAPNDHHPSERGTMKTIVLKLGGAVCLRPETLEALTEGLAKMLAAGYQPVLVHGGGPQLDKAIQALGEPVVKHKGLRYTSKAAAAIVERELDAIGAALTEALQEAGLPAVHFGTDLRLVSARPKRLPDGYDLGRVGSYDAFDAGLLSRAIANENGTRSCIPIITPVGFDDEGPLNVNADEAAAAIASSIKADRLFMATDVPNIRDGGGMPLRDIDESDAAELIIGGAAQGGMVPKLMAALSALQGGVPGVLVTMPTLESLEAAIADKPPVGTWIKATHTVRISFGQDTVKVHQVEA